MKMRVYELAEELKMPAKELIGFLNKEGIKVKNHMSALDEDTVELIKEIIDDNLKKKIEIIKIENYIFKLPETSDYLEPTIEVFFKKKAGFKKFDYFRKFHQEFDKILAKRASSFDEFKKNKLLKNEFRIIISVL